MDEQAPRLAGEAFDAMGIIAALDRHGVEYVVVGGYAAALHGATRPTYDIDVTPSTTQDNLTRLAGALDDLGARIRTDAVPEGLPFATSAQTLAGMKMVNLTTDAGDLDLTFSPSGTDGYDDLARAAITLHTPDGAQVRVAALRDIIRSKEAAGRAKDRDALPELRRLAGLSRNSDAADFNSPDLRASRPKQLSAQERIAAARAATTPRRRGATGPDPGYPSPS